MPKKLTDKEWETLAEFVKVSEEFAGSDPEMPSFTETESRFDDLLEQMKAIVAV